MRYIDAHNHLQDQRLSSLQRAIISECERLGVSRAVVNGTLPRDWPRVAELATTCPWVFPSFGVHPWYIDELPDNYIEELVRYLDQRPSGVGEIGIDHWRDGLDRARQEEVFLAQLRIAQERNLPVTIHGLKAWGRLLELLHKHGVPSRGFLLHSYSGPRELIQPFVDLGAYFSVAPAFFAPQRATKLAIFRFVPPDRLLPETDAPDQAPSAELDLYPTAGYPAPPINHPGNIKMVYAGLCELLAIKQDELARCVEENFTRLFGVALP